MIRVLQDEDVLPSTCAALGADRSDVDLLAQAIRRAAALLAPTSSSDLARFVAEPLGDLGIDRNDVEEALETRISYGDVLEMRRLDSDPWDAPEYVLRPAPPAFVIRSNGDFIILGVAGDLPSALTPDLDARVVSRDGIRTLRPETGERLEAYLHLLGLVKLPEQAWLRHPDQEAAAAHVARWVERLHPVADGGLPAEELEILDPARDVRYYRGRWVAPDQSTSGLMIARRPQLYGAALWSFLEFDDGRAVRWLDFEAGRDRSRPYDLAWRLQAAIDAERRTPQEIRVSPSEDGTRFDFFSPLPGFAERRLTLVGEKRPGEHSLFGFLLDAGAAARELTALQDLLWMRVQKEGSPR